MKAMITTSNITSSHGNLLKIKSLSYSTFCMLLLLAFCVQSPVVAQETADASEANLPEYLAHNDSAPAESPVDFSDATYTKAVFAGAQQENFQAYVAEHVEFPETGVMTGKSGSMKVWFEVLPSGRVGNVRIQDSPGADFDEAVVQCLQNMPQWTPAFLNSTPVKSTSALRLNFTLR